MLVCRLHNIVSWKLSPSVDILIDNSVNVSKDANSLMNSLDIHVQQSEHHDSGDTDTDDYADSDN